MKKGALLPNGEYAPLQKAKYTFDFSTLKIREIAAKETGNMVRGNGFKTCPICGHHDCFRFVPNSEAFVCFSSECGAKGSIVHFIMYVKKFNYSQAVRYLLDFYFNDDSTSTTA
ncbi:MAG: hypothetical protein K9M55_07350 [Candidatus Marinimicrobia bacterium]|nr:hypothetical protein [Candidatus Neomarinimicrobiota bacterium]